MSMSHHPLRITTLSPVHIGCDEDFEPSNFVIDNGLLHALDPADLAAALDNNDKQKLQHLADERNPIGAIQQFFKQRRAHLAQFARQQIDVVADIAREYEEKAGVPQQRSHDGRVVYNLFPMARTAFNPLDGAPYLPGSSLKGSIRTAWLNHLIKGKAFTGRKEDSSQLQQRLLDYQPGKFENDPFRSVALADAHAPEEQLAPPTRILYAVSKKKKPSERAPSELKVFLETVRETLPDAFSSELRLSGKISWNALCDACNTFYRPQLESELRHVTFAPLLDPQWRALISTLLANELGELIAARQGFLLRIGKHSGAESITLDGVRSIKIMGAKGQPPSYRPETTEKRFASATHAATSNLLPFGWIWVSGCDDAHQHLAVTVQQQIAQHASPILEAHAERLAAADARAEARREAQRRQAEEAAARQAKEQAKAEAAAARKQALSTMTPNQRQIEEFHHFCQKRAEQLGKHQEALSGDIHSRARELVAKARDNTEWTAEEKHALADVVSEWLPKLVRQMDKDQLKKLKLAALRGN